MTHSWPVFAIQLQFTVEAKASEQALYSVLFKENIYIYPYS